MKFRLKRVEPIQAGKMFGALYGAMGLIFVPIMLLVVGVGAAASHGASQDAAAPAFLFGTGIGFIIVMPILYAAMGFVIGALGALLYNVFARWIGGLAFEFESESEPPRL